MGALPGDDKTKVRVFETPYIGICNELFGRGDAYEILKKQGGIEFMSTSYVRGLTLKNAIVLVDECQNLNSMEINSIMTRAGENCRFILCGDTKQDDLTGQKHQMSGISDLLRTINKMKSFKNIQFGVDDIVRGGLCREWIIASDRDWETQYYKILTE